MDRDECVVNVNLASATSRRPQTVECFEVKRILKMTDALNFQKAFKESCSAFF